MRITNRNIVAALQPLKRNGIAQGPQAAANRKSDRLSISNEAKRLQEADMERIAALKEQIANGDYEVDLEKLARAIINKGLV